MRYVRRPYRHIGYTYQWLRDDGSIYLTLHRSTLDGHERHAYIAGGDRVPVPSTWLVVPPGALASLAAGDDPAPVLDYLIETYSDDHPWIAEAVAAIAARSPA